MKDGSVKEVSSIQAGLWVFLLQQRKQPVWRAKVWNPRRHRDASAFGGGGEMGEAPV